MPVLALNSGLLKEYMPKKASMMLLIEIVQHVFSLVGFAAEYNYDLTRFPYGSVSIKASFVLKINYYTQDLSFQS